MALPKIALSPCRLKADFLLLGFGFFTEKIAGKKLALGTS
jgi:hypothetical protein